MRTRTRVLKGSAIKQDDLDLPFKEFLPVYALDDLLSAVRDVAKNNMKMYHDDKRGRWVCTCQITIVEGKA